MLSDYELRRSRLFPYHFMADNPAPPEPNPPESPGVPQASSAGSGQAGFAGLWAEILIGATVGDAQRDAAIGEGGVHFRLGGDVVGIEIKTAFFTDNHRGAARSRKRNGYRCQSGIARSAGAVTPLGRFGRLDVALLLMNLLLDRVYELYGCFRAVQKTGNGEEG